MKKRGVKEILIANKDRKKRKKEKKKKKKRYMQCTPHNWECV